MPRLFARLVPRSLLGQMLLAVAAALLVAQAISAVLLYRAQEQRRELSEANALVFQLVADPRFDFRQRDRRGSDGGERSHWRRLRVERTTEPPLHAGETRLERREQQLRDILTGQGVSVGELVVIRRSILDDPYVLNDIPRWRLRDGDGEGEMLLAGLRREGQEEWAIARITQQDREPRQIGQLIVQTLLLYVVLVGGLALLLLRITRPLAALTGRLETFAETREMRGQLVPSGPSDTKRLIAAHNAMESRIVALLDEKNVMLGAIGHDLKTPLAALRVRIESVSDATERQRMADTVEDITRSLDDILSLARVGRPSDPLERTDLAALTASVVEEFEDMGEPVELGRAERIALPLRATWLRRALRNLLDNALRYGQRARVSVLREANEAVIRIEDDGPGISDAEIGRMLEPFTRGEGSRNRGTGGAGLGLTLARAIAEQHGGRLELANRLADGGTVAGLTATLRLPLD